MNQQLIRGPIKQLIRGIGRRREQQCHSSERKVRDLWLVGEPLPASFRRSLSPVRAYARWSPGEAGGFPISAVRKQNSMGAIDQERVFTQTLFLGQRGQWPGLVL